MGIVFLEKEGKLPFVNLCGPEDRFVKSREKHDNDMKVYWQGGFAF
jgi:hypothetical protein